MSAKQTGGRTPWLDSSQDSPVIAAEAQRLESFVAAMADGRIDADELKAQEARLVATMKAVEPLLSEELHAKVTQLLCELTAYDTMNLLHLMDQSRPKTAFRG